MARKRKDLDVEDALPPKKFRRGVDDEQESDLKNNPFDDDVPVLDNTLIPDAAYRKNGEQRSWTEARYDWKYVCDVEGCGQRFNRPCRLEQHKQFHNDERPFACSYEDCDKTFRRKDHLKRHMEDAHSSSNVKRFACDWDGCKKSFPNAGKLKRHMEVHENKFYCTDYPPCKELFRKQKTLDQHIRIKHMTGDPFPCTQTDEETGKRCTKTFQSETGLRRHVVNSHGENSKKHMYNCYMCPAPGTEMQTIPTEAGVVTIAKEPLEFATYQEMVDHNNECHPPVCSECGKKFTKKENLTVHAATIHANPKDRPRFPCPHIGCDKVFNKESNLKVHFGAVHEKKKSFICDASSFIESRKEDLKNWDGNNACGTPFATKVAVENHVRTQHLQPKNKEKKKTRKSQKKPEPSALRLLTGVGYDGGRNVSCLFNGCDYRYFMDRDLRRHLRDFHEVPESEVDDMLMERDALQGGQFWLGGMDEPFFEPETPDPFQTYQGPIIPNDDQDMKPIDPRLISMDNPFDLHKMSLLDAEEAELDKEMGLDELKTWNAQNGLPYGA